MSSQAQDGTAGPPDSPRQALVAALHVRRYGRIAVAFAAVFAVAVALFFLVVVSGGRTEFPLAYYPALAFVVFVTTAMLALAVLVGRRVLHLAVHPASVVRWSATGGGLAAVAWLAAAAGLALGPGRPWAAIADVATPWAALLTPFGLWAVHTRFKRTSALRPLAASSALLAVAGALVLADIAAFDLIALLPDVGRPVDPGSVALFRAGATALVAGQTTVALLAILGDGEDAGPLLLAIPSLPGLAALLALEASRPGLAALAAGLGTSWLLVCWRLRRVPDESVPDDPDPVSA